jgi:hypothetical protein
MPTYSKKPDVELDQLKKALLHLADNLASQAQQIEAGKTDSSVSRVALYREQALTLRYLLEQVEALEPFVEEKQLKQAALLAGTKAKLELSKKGR